MNPRYELLDEPNIPSTGLSASVSQESTAGGALRNLLRTDVRALESFIGAPGDIGAGLLGLGNLASQAVAGRNILPETIPFLPTTESVRSGISNVAQKISPNVAQYLEPQSEAQAKSDEYVQDLVSFLHPIGGKGNVARKILAPTLGNLAQYGAEQFGLSEPYKKGIKAGTMLLTSLGGMPSLKKQAEDLYKAGEAAMPKGPVPLSAKPILDSIDKLKKTLRSGDPKTPSKLFINDRLSALQNSINKKDKTISLEEIPQFIKDFNEFFTEGSIPKVARSYMHDLMEGLNRVLESGKKVAPDAINNFQEARDIWKTIHTSTKANDFVQSIADKLKNKSFSPFTSYLFGIPQAAGGLIGSQIASSASNILDRVFRSKNVMKLYGKALGNALKENAAGTGRSIDQLNRAIEKEFPEFNDMKINSDKYEVLD